MRGLALSLLLNVFGAWAAGAVWERMNGVLGSSVLLDPAAKVDPSKQEIIWMFIASRKSPVTILHHVPVYMRRAEPSEQFRSRLEFNLSNGSLMVNGLKGGDQGNYSLTVDDRELKIIQLSLFGNLSEALIFTTFNSLGSTIRITCNVSGDPLQYWWWKDGAQISQHHQLIDGNRTLVILNASRCDSGTYTCVATNPFSSIQTHFALIIPDPASGSSSVTSWLVTCLIILAVIVCAVIAVCAVVLWRRKNRTTRDHGVGGEQDGAELQRLSPADPESAQLSDNGCARLSVTVAG